MLRQFFMRNFIKAEYFLFIEQNLSLCIKILFNKLFKITMLSYLPWAGKKQICEFTGGLKFRSDNLSITTLHSLNLILLTSKAIWFVAIPFRFILIKNIKKDYSKKEKDYRFTKIIAKYRILHVVETSKKWYSNKKKIIYIL